MLGTICQSLGYNKKRPIDFKSIGRLETERATYLNHKPPVFFIYLYGVSQFSAGTKFYNIGGLNFDGRAGLRIPSFAGFTADFLKCAEADQRDFTVFLLQRFGYAVHKRV